MDRKVCKELSQINIAMVTPNCRIYSDLGYIRVYQIVLVFWTFLNNVGTETVLSGPSCQTIGVPRLAKLLGYSELLVAIFNAGAQVAGNTKV